MEAIIVGARFRPLSESEKISQVEYQKQFKLKNDQIWRIYPDHNVIINSHTKTNHKFDYVFSESSSNQEVFQSLAMPFLSSLIEGTNLTIFAYGQTSSGKTHTMKGNSMNPGITPLTINAIFAKLNESDIENYTIVVSYLEVYNEQINDLLDITNSKILLRINSSGEVDIANLTEISVKTELEAMGHFISGETNRKVGDNSMNQESSRSHTVFRMKFECNKNNRTLVSEINLVDLAGSEGASNEENRNREGANINKSILALSRLICALSELHDNGKKQYLNYRDSKLTRILQNSLSGSSNIAIICNLTPALTHYQESINTLSFGTRAKKIKISPQVNEIINEENEGKKDKKIIKDLKNENEDLINKINKLEKCNEKLIKENSELKEIYDRNEQDSKGFDQKIVENSSYFNMYEPRKSYDFSKSLENSILEKNEKISILETENAKLKSENNKKYIEQDIMESDEQIKNNEMISNMYILKLNNLETINNQLKEELDNAQKNLELQIIKLKEENSHLITANTSLKSQYVIIEDSTIDIGKQNTHLIQEVERLNQVIFRLNNEKNNSEEILAIAREKYEELQASFSLQERQNELLQTEFTQLRKSNEILSRENENYKENQRKYEENVQNYEEKMINYGEKLRGVEEKLRESEKNHEENLREIEKNHKEALENMRIQEKSNILNKENQPIKEIRKEISISGNITENNALGIERKILQEKNNKGFFIQYEDSSKEESKPEVLKQQNHIDELKIKNSKLINNNSELEEKLEKEKLRINDLEYRHSCRRLSSCLIDKRLLEDITDSDKFTYEQELNIYKLMADQNEIEIKRLLRDLKFVRETNDKLDKVSSKNERKIIQLSDSIEDKDKEIQELKNKIKEIYNEKNYEIN